MEWPKKSGMMQEFPEIDRGGWFPIEIARTKLIAGQAGFLDQLVSKLGTEKNPSAARSTKYLRSTAE
jgi:predicted NUDIX family NTP pyrophosphohydrolase